jgi:hypothetical protein
VRADEAGTAGYEDHRSDAKASGRERERGRRRISPLVRVAGLASGP